MSTCLHSRWVSGTAAAWLFACGVLHDARGAAMSEPPAVLYGKVIQLGNGAAYQLYDGDLVLTIVNQADPSHQIIKQVPLRPTGNASEFSYRVELPQKYLPASFELSEHLEVGYNPTAYRFESITINDTPAAPLDSEQSMFNVSFADRAGQHRLDLLVSLVEDDTDGDGIPDWWEDLHGLNRLGPTDALLDTDTDGLINLDEFKKGTDPNESNTTPLLRTATVTVPSGGVAGLGLVIVDSDTDPGSIQLTLGAALPLLSVRRGAEIVTPGAPFTYEEVLQGAITMDADGDFAGGTLQLTIQDLGPGLAQVIADLDIDVFSPMEQLGKRPSVWLDGRFVSGSPVDEWPDQSGNDRDGYQPYAVSQPFSQSDAVDFAGTGFLYLDERGLRLNEFTAFAAFDTADIGATDQTLLNSTELSVRIRNSLDATQAQALVILQPGRSIHGPVLGAHTFNQMTLVSGPLHSSLNLAGQWYVQGRPATNSLAQSFATLGGSQSILQSTAEELFGGRLREMLIYDQPLTPGDRTRNEDYQRSRWGSLVVWDYRRATTPLLLQADPSRPNALSGGWGEDRLIGGPWADILRGGPGTDELTGGPGPDQFHFMKENASDLATDYSPQQFDLLDLSDIFGEQTGDPSDFITVRTEVVRDENNVPHVFTMLDLNYDGQGSGVDQTIRLGGVALSAGQLPLLVSKGLIRLGGPQYEGLSPVVTFHDWLAIQYPGQAPAGLAASDTEGDGIQAIFEFLYETNPHEVNSRESVPVHIRRDGDHLAVEVITRENVAGVDLGLAGSLDLLTWPDAASGFSLDIEPLGYGQARHLYRSIQPLESGAASQFFRLRATETPVTP